MEQIKTSGKIPSFSDLSKTKLHKNPKQFYFTNLILSIIEILRKTIYTFRFFSAGIIPLCFVMSSVIRRQTY